jgi:hypothetical protein
MALLAALCSFAHLFEGLTNRSLRALVAELIPGYTARQTTYDLRRLRRKGLSRRIPRTQRYQLTADGRRLAVFFTKTYTPDRVPHTRRTRPPPTRPDRTTHTTRPALARVRTRARHTHRRRRHHDLKHDPPVNNWTTKRS